MLLALALVLAAPARSLAAPPDATPIVHGDAVPAGGWPSVVAIASPSPGAPGEEYRCTGTLVAPDLVLTAAHCLRDAAAEDVRVWIGEVAGVTSLPVLALGVHPEAGAQDPDPLDYGYLRLAAAADVEPVEILTTQAEWDELMAIGAPLVVVGFGATTEPEHQSLAEQLAPPRKRQAAFELQSRTDDGDVFVAGHWPRDTCWGDSGGPAFARLASGAWRQIGVHFRGVHPCGRASRSQFGVPLKALAWLRDATDVDLLPPGCEDGDCVDTRLPAEGCGCRSAAAPGWALLLLLARRRPRARCS